MKQSNCSTITFNINSCQSRSKTNRFQNNNEIIIIADEAHLAIDKDNPVTLNFMFQIVKRIRKYHGSVAITMQKFK